MNRPLFLFGVGLFCMYELGAMKFEKTGFPKWDGLVDLRSAGLTTPDAVFVKPYSANDHIQTIVDNFFAAYPDIVLVALRPDGKDGVGKSPAGISFDREKRKEIVERLFIWSSEGYGVTIIETHNRFDYDFCGNVLFLNEDGNFVIEFVGPGFDGGDLNKSILKPTMTVRGKDEMPILEYSDQISGEQNIEALRRLFFRVDIEMRFPTEEELQTRLKYIMLTLLPDMGIRLEKTISATVDWLRKNGNDRLLQKRVSAVLVPLDVLEQIIFQSSLYAHDLLRKGERLTAKALTIHGYDGKFVFFGAFNGHKWGK